LGSRIGRSFAARARERLVPRRQQQLQGAAAHLLTPLVEGAELLSQPVRVLVVISEDLLELLRALARLLLEP
jgi:hypothetical protein